MNVTNTILKKDYSNIKVTNWFLIFLGSILNFVIH